MAPTQFAVAAPPLEVGPEINLLHDINGLADSTPHWLDESIVFFSEYGMLAILALLGIGSWLWVRRGPDHDKAVAGVAALLWAPLAAVLAYGINTPIRGFVERPRPLQATEGLNVLLSGKGGFSFVSDHAGVAMALAVGIFVAHRKLGFLAIGLTLLLGLSRVYIGVHYPTDVIGGFALGTATALLLAPIAMSWLTPPARRLTRAPLAVQPELEPSLLPDQRRDDLAA